MSENKYVVWDGVERRDIPSHILRHINEAIACHTDQANVEFHEIKNELKDMREASEARHHTLIDQLAVILGRQALMDKAFITTLEGFPDYVGHHQFHLDKKTFKEALERIKFNAMSRLVEYLVIGMLIIFLLGIVEKIKVM